MAENMTVWCNSSVRVKVNLNSNVPAGLFARTFRLFPTSTVGHRGLHILRFSLSTRPLRVPARPYSFIKRPGTPSTQVARFFASNGTTLLPAPDLPVLSPPAVGNWFMLSSALFCSHRCRRRHATHRVLVKHHQVVAHHWLPPAALTDGVEVRD